MIEFQNVSMAYKDRPVLNHVDLTIQDSEFFVLIGSSGCGKTTLLKSINKLLNVQKGKLLINGTPVENIALVMRIAGYTSERISERVTEMLRMVDLDPDTYRNQYPSQLSGGQQQRVGVARAFAVDPPIVLMDEPFSALDPMTRAELQDEIHTIQEGHIVQCDTPERILKAPANQYVTDFIGANRLWANPEYIRARDIMRRRPITISRGRTVLQALQIMRQSGVDSLLVVDGRDRLLGVLWLEELMSEKDGSGSAETYLSDDYVAVEGDTTLKEIISTIDYDVYGIIPVIEHDRTLVGFLTKSSLLATMSRQFVPEHTAGERSGVIWAAAAH